MADTATVKRFTDNGNKPLGDLAQCKELEKKWAEDPKKAVRLAALKKKIAKLEAK